MKLWAMVPVDGTLLNAPVRMLEELAQPAIWAAFPPYTAAQGPCARREPNSETGWLVARQTRDALVATAIWWFRMHSMGVSSTWAWIMGATTVTMGWLGKTISPSRMQYTSPVNFMVLRYLRNSLYASPGRNFS